MPSRRDEDETRPFRTTVAGNELFHRAVFAIGLNGTAVSAILVDTLAAIGSTPDDITIHELGAMMMEVERRLRLLAPPGEAQRAIAGLRAMLLRWDE